MVVDEATNRGLRPEREILLLCARTHVDDRARDRIRHLLGQPLAWPRVLEDASAHAIIPLLHHHLSAVAEGRHDLVPAPVTEWLQRVSVSGAARRLLLLSELKGVLTDLEAGGAPGVVWKGPALAYSVYPRPELRPFADLDILVRRRDVSRAREVLGSRGYAPRPGLELSDGESFARSDHTVPMIHGPTGVCVDLHWGGGARYLSSAMDTDMLCEQAGPLMVGETPLPALMPDALLLALSVHGAKHGPFPWPRLKWITDVEAFLRTYREDQWAAILARARVTGCQRMVLLGICLARELLEAPVPAAAADAIRDDPAVTPLVPAIRDRLLSESPTPFTFGDRVRFDLAVRERVRDRVRYRYERLLTISPRDVAALRLPAPLRFLQVPVRLMRLAGTYILRPSRIGGLYSGRRPQSAPGTDSSPDRG
jgi:hypothetical protein